MERFLKSTTRTIIGWFSAFVFSLSAQSQEPQTRNPELEKQLQQLFAQLPPVQKKLENITEAQLASRRTQEQNHQKLSLEKKEGKWTAALVDEQTWEIQERFQTLPALLRYAEEREALVEIWAIPEAGKQPRRIPATEIPELKKQLQEQPTFLTVTFRGSDKQVVKRRVEFSFLAAEAALQTQLGYRKHRDMMAAARAVLSARNESGRLSASAQWEALMEAVLNGRLPLKEVPREPRTPRDLFVAFEFEVDEQNQWVRALRIYRESEVERRVVEDRKDEYVQVLVLNKEGTEREVRGFRSRDLSDELEPVPSPVRGQDAVELRVRDRSQPQPRRWNVVEFGEPELLRDAALARFSLLNAHIDKKRKEIAIKKSNLDLIAEPIFAGLNVGAGLAMVPFPLGEAARLGYNSAVTPWFIPDIPTVKEMRELFLLLAAKDKDPTLRAKPARYLDREDIAKLESIAKQLTDREVRDYLETMSEEDIRAMLRLPKFQQIDARVSNLLSIIADAGKVSGWTDEPGFQREVFNSIYFSVTGEISIKNIIAVLAGGKVATPLSGYSLYDLSHGRGPPEAWLQYLNLTVDVRAVLNTIARVSHSSLAGKELKKPFPYAPRMTDLAAYEVRIFGFPLLLFHKRGLLKEDYAAFTNDYAYGLIGTRIVEHFATKSDMDREIRAGTMVPLGYVKVFDGKGGWKNSNLAVFAHKVRTGKHKGKTTVIIYGLKAYRENSELIEREYRRFQQYEQALHEGGVIEQQLAAGTETKGSLSPITEPQIFVGPKVADERFSPILGALLEWRRLEERRKLGLEVEKDTEGRVEQLLKSLNISPDSPLLGLDPYYSTFIYKRQVEGGTQVVRVCLLPGPTDIARAVAKAEQGVRIERQRRAAVSSGGPGAVLVHRALQRPWGWEVGPLLTNDAGAVTGLRSSPEAVSELLSRIQRLPSTQRALLEQCYFASMLMDVDGEKVFATIDFPLGAEVRQTWINPVTGEAEVRFYDQGHLTKIVTARRVTRLSRDAQGDEVASETCRNVGSIENPRNGHLLEKTRTLTIWKRLLTASTDSPTLPTAARLRANFVTGQVQVEGYAYHPLPISVSDSLLVTSNRYDASGSFVEAVSWVNRSDAETVWSRMLQPKQGRERFLVRRVDGQERPGLLRVEKKDSITGLTRQLLLDLAHDGRTLEELWTDQGGDWQRTYRSRAEFAEDYFEGQVPLRKTVVSQNGIFLSSTETISYDPLSRRLKGRTVDYTGLTSTQTWQHGFANPLETETAFHKTVTGWNEWETGFSSTTLSPQSGELLRETSGSYNSANKKWAVRRIVFHEAGVTNRVETEMLSQFGLPLQSRVQDALETRFEYDTAGRLQGLRTFYSTNGGQTFDVPQTVETDFKWKEGTREAVVERLVHGKPYSRCVQVRDSSGRLVANWRRPDEIGELRTLWTYDGSSERVLAAEVFQNGMLRQMSKGLGVKKAEDGSHQLVTLTRPQWGLSYTQVFLLGDPLARPLVSIFENGEQVKVAQWHEGTAIPSAVDLHDRHGRLKQRSTRALNQGIWRGLDYDVVQKFAVNHWGASFPVEKTCLLADSDIPLFSDVRALRTIYDLAKGYEAPAFTLDLSGKTGVRVTGIYDSNVVRVFRTALLTNGLQVDQIDLGGLFSQQFTRKQLSRAGHVLEEKVGLIPSPGQDGFALEKLFSNEPRFSRFVVYRYEPGWLVEGITNGTRQVAFQTSAPPLTAGAIRCNDGTWPDFPTAVFTSQSTSDSEVDSNLLQRFISRRLQGPRYLETNPYLPGRASLWTAWSAAGLKYDGGIQFEEELVFDAAGKPCLSKSFKQASDGSTATRIHYTIMPLELSELQTASAGTVPLALPQDCSGDDWLYLQVAGTNADSTALWLQDAEGHVVEVSHKTTNAAPGKVGWWPTEENLVRWLPTKLAPKQEILLQTSPLPNPDDAWLVVSVHDLVKAGLNVQNLKSAELRGAEGLLHSGLHRLARQGEFVPLGNTPETEISVAEHSSGLKTIHLFGHGPKDDRFADERHVTTLVEWQALPVASAQVQSRSGSETLIFKDQADGDAASILYGLSLRDGQFVEHYKTVRLGDAQIYTLVHGFNLPRRDIHRGAYLEDETGPGLLSFGQNYGITIPRVTGQNALERLLGLLQGRVMANGFNYAGRRVFDSVDHRPERLNHFDYEGLHEAKRQAAEIQKLPTLAEALLAAQSLPWAKDEPIDAPELAQDWRRLKLELNHHYLKYPTGLIPTSLGSAQERYVETAGEADIVLLALKLRETGVAREILDFYWRKSQGGTRALHASYDAQAGTAMASDPRYRRSVHAPRTAEAQLAVAEAAFAAGLHLGDSRYFNLGKNLLRLTLEKFRAPSGQDMGVRGIAEEEYEPVRRTLGLAFWPESEHYALRSNARAYLLLHHLLPVAELGSDPGWKSELATALKEQGDWLRTYIVPEAERSGIVPMGVFALQDIHQPGTALVPERSTATEDWLWFLEAADAMGLPKPSTRRWLENLARAHGVRIHETWGLDWQVGLLRPDALSPQLTAHFAHVANLLGHSDAANFALNNLRRMRTEAGFASGLTAQSPGGYLRTAGQTILYPNKAGDTWAARLGAEKYLVPRPNQPEPVAQAAPLLESSLDESNGEVERADSRFFLGLAGLFYLLVLGCALFWWRFRTLRKEAKASALPDDLVPERVLHLAEERWAKRVLGLTAPDGAEMTRYSNAPVEQNFLMQLRAIYKLLLEWRRQENGWAEEDARLTEGDADGWMNGMDEFVVVIGLYMRQVIKAGAKDGFAKENFWRQNEDSNHIWSRLVLYFSEYYWALLTLTRNYQNQVLPEARTAVSMEMAQLLSQMGVRQRPEAFDARELFNYPANPKAMDLLVVQKPGATLEVVMEHAAEKLNIPMEHIERILRRYQDFKKREQPFPIHPYTIEFSKLLPHFLLMGLGALVWYNEKIGDSSIAPYLWSLVTQLTPLSLLWAVPLAIGILAEIAANFVQVYRFEAPMLERKKAGLFLDATVTSFFGKQHSVLPKARAGKRWDPDLYRHSSWAFRASGWLGLGIALLLVETPGFATFLVVKGLAAMVAFAEVAAIILPLLGSYGSKALQDYVSSRPHRSKLPAFLNRLNITATKPASPLWLSFKYYTQPSVPTGSWWSMTQAVLFFFTLSGLFLVVGGYLTQQILSLWFTDTYLNANNWKLFFGGLIFWNTMYLLRYGLFLLFTGAASFFSTFPLKGLAGVTAAVYLLLEYLLPSWSLQAFDSRWVQSLFLTTGLAAILFERQILRLLKKTFSSKSPSGANAVTPAPAASQETLGIVYMSGDELSSRKLTTELLLGRWMALRDKLGSKATHLLSRMVGQVQDATLQEWFEELYRKEEAAEVTLWHPAQVAIQGEAPLFKQQLGLTIWAADAEQKQRLLNAWHVRRWLVSMMSTAGHSQDTGINLVEIATRLASEKLSERTVFYLVQNKYDNSDNNRPSQSAYAVGELAQRNKLARLLCALAPGARAYSLQNWTPFGFKAGGLTGMDLVPEETMRLGSMLLLDRNATVHDLDALVVDLKRAISDPDVVIVIPGRGTTNTHTSLGQASQMVEEGHRSFLKGLMNCLGGTASEAVGTGWGNLLAVFYGRAQRAMLNAQTLKMPLTSRMQRGSTFQMRCEGLIGFSPHAVGISEDTWAVSQASHNAIALGHRVKYLVSEAIWHKIRETWSHAEWLASFPRWSGGYLQMMHDPLMQRINDFGPASVFAKEVRANSGRNFLSAPFALLNILLMPLAIMLDLTPFVQILIVLWNFGFIMNQILTVHGLNTYLESSGFQRVPAALSAVASALLAFAWAPLQSVAPALVLGGFLAGGFLVGLSRWLYTRLRDMLLFGPQLVLHALGQVVRQTLEFTVSGASPEDAKGVNMAFRAIAGPREDRPLETYPHFMNLRTVVWGFGLLSVGLNLVALTNLDMLNVLLLLPSLLFSVSAMAGPFILTPKVGKPLGIWSLFPKALGWACTICFYTTVSLLMAGGPREQLTGLALLTGVCGLLMARSLRYSTYRWRVGRLCAKLSRCLPRPASVPLYQLLVRQGGHLDKVEAALLKEGFTAEELNRFVEQAERKLGPLLKEPAHGAKSSSIGQSRFISEMCRSFVLSLCILLWFFVVPVPGLFVFTAGDYRIAFALGKIMAVVFGGLTVIVAASWLGRLMQWFEANGMNSLKRSLERGFKDFEELNAAGIAPAEQSWFYALFTDVQLYLDQRSYGYARRQLRAIHGRLKVLKARQSSLEKVVLLSPLADRLAA